jgi:uncharacterized protein YecE (DUF72 family)
MRYDVGCSGYYYPQWRNKLYPRGLAPRGWLAHYATFFNTVELNGTFYRLPTLEALKKYVAQTPGDFVFSVKASRYITHIQRLKDKQAILAFTDLVGEGLGSRLAHVLFQMPPSFHFSEENLQKVLEGIPHEPHHVIEFRHASWWNDLVRGALQAANITFCNVDYPGLHTYFIHTTPRFYLRLHGNPELYFNNTITEAGYENALAFKSLIGQESTVRR